MRDVANEDRACLGEDALEAFARRATPGRPFEEMDDEELQDQWRDLLTDMCHYARLKGWDFAPLIAQAVGMHNEEEAEDPDRQEEILGETEPSLECARAACGALTSTAWYADSDPGREKPCCSEHCATLLEEEAQEAIADLMLGS